MKLCPASHALAPLAAFVPICDRCMSQAANCVFGCAACNYAVCKWCFMGGDRLLESLQTAERAISCARKAVEHFKEELDSDIYVWV